MPLTRAGMYRIMDNMWSDIQELRFKTGLEYAPDQMKPFGNFEKEAEEEEKTREEALWSHFWKQYNAIRNWVNAKPEDRPAMETREPIINRIHDAILYLAILRAMVGERDLDAVPDAESKVDPGLMRKSGLAP